jgi:hypothetical protein
MQAGARISSGFFVSSEKQQWNKFRENVATAYASQSKPLSPQPSQPLPQQIHVACTTQPFKIRLDHTVLLHYYSSHYEQYFATAIR